MLIDRRGLKMTPTGVFVAFESSHFSPRSDRPGKRPRLWQVLVVQGANLVVREHRLEAIKPGVRIERGKAQGCDTDVGTEVIYHLRPQRRKVHGHNFGVRREELGDRPYIQAIIARIDLKVDIRRGFDAKRENPVQRMLGPSTSHEGKLRSRIVKQPDTVLQRTAPRPGKL